MKRTINLTLFFFVTLCIVGCPQLFFSRFEFFPEKYNAADYSVKSDIKSKDVYITAAKGTKLHAWYFEVPRSTYTVIMHHGQSRNIAYFRPSAEVFARAGASVLLYDYEGFGLSEGVPSNAAMRRDAEACYWYVRKNLGVAPEQFPIAATSVVSVPAQRNSARIGLLSWRQARLCCQRGGTRAHPPERLQSSIRHSLSWHRMQCQLKRS